MNRQRLRTVLALLVLMGLATISLWPALAQEAREVGGEPVFLKLKYATSDPLQGERAVQKACLPVVLKNLGEAPVPPAAPTLNPIDNADGDGNYTVSWTESAGADTYLLQEDDDDAFSSPVTAYAGSLTSVALNGRPVGTYYYRVRAVNAYGDSGWSNTQSVVVTPGSWMTILREDFEGAFPGPWSVEDGNPDSGVYYWGKRNCRAYDGSYSGWAVGGGEGASLSCGENYPLNVLGWMVYGPFSLADASDADLTFQLWLNSETNWDKVFYAASTNGSNFSGYVSSGNTDGWVLRQLDLTDVPTLGDLIGEPEVWIALLFVSDGTFTNPEGAYVDDIVLRKYVGAATGSQLEATPPDPATLHQEVVTFTLGPGQ